MCCRGADTLAAAAWNPRCNPVAAASISPGKARTCALTDNYSALLILFSWILAAAMMQA
jgi:hypothetical protein